MGWEYKDGAFGMRRALQFGPQLVEEVLLRGYADERESSRVIDYEKTLVQNYDKRFLIDLEEYIKSFRSDYAIQTGYTVSNMKDVKTEDLVLQLEEYSTVLAAACEQMKEREEKIANSFVWGGAS